MHLSFYFLLWIVGDFFRRGFYLCILSLLLLFWADFFYYLVVYLFIFLPAFGACSRSIGKKAMLKVSHPVICEDSLTRWYFNLSITFYLGLPLLTDMGGHTQHLEKSLTRGISTPKIYFQKESLNMALSPSWCFMCKKLKITFFSIVSLPGNSGLKFVTLLVSPWLFLEMWLHTSIWHFWDILTRWPKL